MSDFDYLLVNIISQFFAELDNIWTQEGYFLRVSTCFVLLFTMKRQ